MTDFVYTYLLKRVFDSFSSMKIIANNYSTRNPKNIDLVTNKYLLVCFGHDSFITFYVVFGSFISVIKWWDYVSFMVTN